MRVLLAIDESPCSEAAVRLLARLASPGCGTVQVVTVLEPRPPVAAGMSTWETLRAEIADHRSHAQARLATDAAKLRSHGYDVATQILEGSTAQRIVEAAEEYHADLLVVGSHGRSAMSRLVMGSVSHSVVLHAHCPVLVARPMTTAAAAPLKILVAFDGSAAATAAVAALAKAPFCRGADIRVVTAQELISIYRTDLLRAATELLQDRDRQMLAAAEAAADTLRPTAGAVCASVAKGARAHEVILDIAAEHGVDLIVLGDKGESGFHRFLLGSVAHRITDRAPCSVLVSRP